MIAETHTIVESFGGPEVNLAVIWWCLLVAVITVFAVNDVATKRKVPRTAFWVLFLASLYVVSAPAEHEIATRFFRMIHTNMSVGWWVDFPAWPAPLCGIIAGLVALLVRIKKAPNPALQPTATRDDAGGCG